jgi:hypothetical protein
MAGKPINLVGHVYGLLTVTRQAGMHTSPSGTRSAEWYCDCSCGTKDVVRTARYLRLSTDKTKSCGCVHAAKVKIMLVERNTTHGQAATRLYAVWSSMKSRCLNENDTEYANYGGRGIIVSQEWLMSFEQFKADMGEPPTSLHTLDRREVNGNYSKANCRWATMQEQNNNRRNTVMITLGERTQSLMDWSRELGIPRCTIRYRLRHGWSIEKTLTT